MQYATAGEIVEELRQLNGSLYARYVYDTWGNTLHIYDANGAEITNTNNLAMQNPIRYRGYYMIQRRGFIDADLRGKVDRTHKQWAFKAYFVYFSVWRGLL